MEPWLKISLLLCIFGFAKELRPSEPFVTEFLSGEWRNITIDEVNREVYPVSTYSYLAQLVIIFLITDFLRYKPLIIVAGVAGIALWSILLWTTSLLWLQITQVLYGTFMACEVAYYTYIYAKVDRIHYQKVTSYTRAAILSGRFVAGISGQLLVRYSVMNYRELNYVTFAALIFATIWAIFLPAVKTSVYFHRQTEKSSLVPPSAKDQVHTRSAIEAFKLLFSHFKLAYTNPKVLQWSFWYSMALGGFLQVISYAQVLWQAIDNSDEVVWNGAIEAAVTLLGALFALLAGYMHEGILGQKKSLGALSAISLIQGAAILLACMTESRWVSYAGYMLFVTMYSFLITIASAEIAKHLVEDSFGLVFGINTMFALLMQTIITLTVISEAGFALNIFDQYLVLGVYHFILGTIYVVVLAISIIRSRRLSANGSETVPQNMDNY